MPATHACEAGKHPACSHWSQNEQQWQCSDCYQQALVCGSSPSRGGLVASGCLATDPSRSARLRNDFRGEQAIPIQNLLDLPVLFPFVPLFTSPRAVLLGSFSLSVAVNCQDACPWRTSQDQAGRRTTSTCRRHHVVVPLLQLSIAQQGPYGTPSCPETGLSEDTAKALPGTYGRGYFAAEGA